MIYRILAKIERTCARLQGKGWGAATVKEEVDILTKIIKDPKLAIDMGANIGEYTAHLKNKFNDIEIHLFEPSNVNNEKLISRFNNDPKLVINNVAVGDKNGHGTLYSNAPGSSLASLTKRKLSGFDSFETVTIIAFENYWKERLGKRNIDILKIDVEGHELDVLNGMGEALFKTKVIQFEFGGCNIDTRSYFLDFWNFFEKHGFDIFRITVFGLQPIIFYTAAHDFFDTTNFICVNRSKI